MTYLLFGIYNILMQIIAWMISVTALFNQNIKQFLMIRQNYIEQLRLIQNKKSNSNVLIFHGASMGELEQINAVLKELVPQLKNFYLIISYYSPSGKNKAEQIAQSFPSKASALPIPLDLPNKTKQWFHYLQPKLFVSASYDIWPNITKILSHHHVPIALISALLAPDSGRHKGFFRPLFKEMYQKLSLIDCVDSETANRYQKFLQPAPRLSWNGDTRCDAIQSTLGKSLDEEKQNKVNFIKKIIQQFHAQSNHSIVFIAASVYAECDTVLLPALTQIKNLRPTTLYIPHHTDANRINEITTLAKQLNLEYVLFSEIYANFITQSNTTQNNSIKPLPIPHIKKNPLVIIDQIGLLIHLYSLADFAFIGGSFHKKIHNTYEPAANALPLAYGPRHRNAVESIRFLTLGGATLIQNTPEMVHWLDSIIVNQDLRQKQGTINQQEFQRNLGASKKVTDELLQLMQH